jgi:hypothetical protein
MPPVQLWLITAPARGIGAALRKVQSMNLSPPKYYADSGSIPTIETKVLLTERR